MSQAILLMMEELEDNHVNEEEAFKEDFNHPSNGTVHWLLFLLIGLRKAGAQAFVLEHDGHPYCFFRRDGNRL